jgi:glutathione S-transferase
MGDLILTTFDWVPETPRGYVRDLRVRWALEEAELPYRVESGAILLHLGNRSGALMPTDPRAHSEVLEWLFAALNSVEMASLPWSLLMFTGEAHETSAWKLFDEFLKKSRLGHLEPVLAGCEWLAGTFSVADILMADVLRLVNRFDGLTKYPACRDYVARATARPPFVKAHADQMAHFAAAD